jgi:ABC-type glycerol-3-phosphate transport system substrate-binding protein
MDLTDSLEEQLTSDLVDGMLEQCSIDGRVYMLPYWPVCQSAAVYLDAVEEADALELSPQAPCFGWNIEQYNGWLEKMRGTRPDGSERYGLGIPTAYSTPASHWVTFLFFRSFGAVFWTDEAETCVNFATPEATKCLEWMQMLAKNDLIPDPAGYTGEDNDGLVTQGNVAMQLGNVLPGAARQEGSVLDPETLIVDDTVNERHWRFVQYPHDDPHPAIVWGGANYSGLVPFKPKNEAIVSGLTDFLHWMTNAESEEWLVKTAGMLPFRKSILSEVKDDRLIVYTSECLMPTAWFDAKRNPEILVLRSIFDEHFQDAWGGKSAEQVLQEMTEDINSTLKSCA